MEVLSTLTEEVLAVTVEVLSVLMEEVLVATVEVLSALTEEVLSSGAKSCIGLLMPGLGAGLLAGIM